MLLRGHMTVPVLLSTCEQMYVQKIVKVILNHLLQLR